MSRFDATRRGRIAIWTGAALAWGTAVTLAGQEPVRAGADGETPSSIAKEDTVLSSVPTMPDAGLVIIRYQPSVAVTREVRTVYVQQAAPAAARSSAPASAQAPAQAPAPRSSGS